MGLIGIHVNNAANLCPDSLYAALKYTHPALVERLAGIERFMAESVGVKVGELSQQELFERYQEAWKDKIKERHGQGAFDHQGDYVPYEK